VPLGERPAKVTVYVEIVPTDTVKYELEKTTGLLHIDRPQKYSNLCPTLYGLLPQTYCGDEVGALCSRRTGRAGIVGDGDPLDICVLAEKSIPRGDVLLAAIPIGGLRMIDHDEADDKIVAVLAGDAVYGGLTDLEQCPPGLIDRLQHYFLTYKQAPGDEPRVSIAGAYGREEAHEVIAACRRDYDRRYGSLRDLLEHATALNRSVLRPGGLRVARRVEGPAGRGARLGARRRARRRVPGTAYLTGRMLAEGTCRRSWHDARRAIRGAAWSLGVRRFRGARAGGRTRSPGTGTRRRRPRRALARDSAFPLDAASCSTGKRSPSSRARPTSPTR
jgi:inorganic pyrophosphatase